MPRLPEIHVRPLAFDRQHSERSAEFGCTLKGEYEPGGTDYHGGVIILKEIDGGALGHKLRVDICNCDPGVLIIADPANMTGALRAAPDLLEAARLALAYVAGTIAPRGSTAKDHVLAAIIKAIAKAEDDRP